jgi:photosystem II stability/assembly factor-like uncharacterized protein
MKNLITILIFILVSFQSFAQSGWEVQMGNSLANTQAFSRIFFTDDNSGFLLNRSWVKRTTDAGTSWHDTYFQSTAVLNSIFFKDMNTGWITGNRTYRTTNRGDSWQFLDSSIYGNVIWFHDNSTGWIGGTGGNLYKTTNSGDNWQSVNTGILESISDIHFTSPLNGYCAAEWGVVIRTTNGGLNWIKHIDPSLSFFANVEFIDSQTGIVCGSNGTIVRTTNAGINWINNGTGTYSNFRSVKFISSSTGFAFGSLGTVLKTTNTGSSWANLTNTGIYSSVLGASRTATNHLWIVCDSGMVYRSPQGNSWQLILKFIKTREQLYSVYFHNTATGWVCGANNSLLRTTNGGNEWMVVDAGAPAGSIFRSINFLNVNTGYLCGGSSGAPVTGFLKRTINGGINWTTILADTFVVTSASFINANTGWAGGYGGALRKTTNGGLTWISSALPFSYFIVMEVKFLDAETGFACGNTTFRTTNGGSNWEQVILNTNGHKISFVDNNTGYVKAGTINPVIYKTTNSGNNWSGHGIPQAYSLGFYFFSSDRGWLCGTDTRNTTNGGSNWQIQPVPVQARLNAIFFVNENEGWAVGVNGLILHTSSAGIGITPISNEIPQEFMLMQNYPNPFNPTTKIRFQIALRNGHDRSLLKIYDALGREIETLVNEELNPGTYEIEWNAAKYSSGVYFYSLSNGSSTQTKKMVVIK